MQFAALGKGTEVTVTPRVPHHTFATSLLREAGAAPAVSISSDSRVL